MARLARILTSIVPHSLNQRDNKSPAGKSRYTQCICTILVVYVLLPTIDVRAAETKQANAALLYYQAMLLCPDLDSVSGKMIDVVFGPINMENTKITGSIEQVRGYVKDHKAAIQIAEIASNISHCDWALPYAPYGGRSAQEIKVSRQAKALAFLICAEARVFAAEGDYKAGFARCFMLCRIARHFAQWQGTPLPTVLEGSALRCIRQILHEIPPDVDTLRWLSDQFAAKPPVMATLSTQIEQDFEYLFSELRERLLEKTPNEKRNNGDDKLNNEQINDFIQQTTVEFLNPAFEALTADIPDVSKYERITSLVDEFNKRHTPIPVFAVSTSAHVNRVLTLYGNDVSYRTFENALKAAIEIYLLRAKTGSLPEAIPEGLPKDAYSGYDFEYEITNEGFLLRCRTYGLVTGKTRCFAYKVRGKEGR